MDTSRDILQQGDSFVNAEGIEKVPCAAQLTESIQIRDEKQNTLHSSPMARNTLIYTFIQG